MLGPVLAKSGEAAKAGPIGLAVILLLIIACYFLFKSMSRHMRNVRENFPLDDDSPNAVAQPTADVPPTADGLPTTDRPPVVTPRATATAPTDDETEPPAG